MGLFGRARGRVAGPRTVVPWRDICNDYLPTIRGESHYQPELRALLRRSDRWPALLHREPTNTFDPNAVAVTIDGRCVAYLARQEAEEVAGRLAELERQGAVVGFDVVLCGGDRDRPNIGVFPERSTLP